MSVVPSSAPTISQEKERKPDGSMKKSIIVAGFIIPTLVLTMLYYKCRGKIRGAKGRFNKLEDDGDL